MRIWILTAAAVLIGIAISGMTLPVAGLIASALLFSGLFLFEWRMKQQSRLPVPEFDGSEIVFRWPNAALKGSHGDHLSWSVTVTSNDLWLQPICRFDPRTLRLFTDRDYVRVPLFAITDVLGGSVESQSVSIEHLTSGGDRRSLSLSNIPNAPDFVRSLGFEPRPPFFPQSQDQDRCGS